MAWLAHHLWPQIDAESVLPNHSYEHLKCQWHIDNHLLNINNHINNHSFYNSIKCYKCVIPLANASSADTPPMADDPLGKINGVSASKRIWASLPVVWNVRFLFLCADIVKWPSSRNMTDLERKHITWIYTFCIYQILRIELLQFHSIQFFHMKFDFKSCKVYFMLSILFTDKWTFSRIHKL